jgi:prepilin-type N-terminal cleavage/methylation domain-containing protein
MQNRSASISPASHAAGFARRSSDLRSRPAFTLIEMLVTIGILLTLAALTVAFLPALSNYQKVQQAASRLQGWLLTAKQRALRDQFPRGIRLNVVSDPFYGTVVREVQYIEQPDDFSQGTITFTSSTNTATVSTDTDLAGGFDPSGTGANSTLWPVQVGDYLQIPGHTSATPVFRITGVTSVNQSPKNQITTANPTLNGTSGGPYTIIRAPRVLTGEPVLQLPQDVVIDLNNVNVGAGSSLIKGDVGGTGVGITNASNASPIVITSTGHNLSTGAQVFISGVAGNTNANGYFTITYVDPNNFSLNGSTGNAMYTSGGTWAAVNYDVVFAPSGSVTRAGGQSGKIILWMRDVTQDTPNPGTMFFVVIYTRTGTIAVHPVAGSGNPYSFATDGKDSGV